MEKSSFRIAGILKIMNDSPAESKRYDAYDPEKYSELQ